MSSASFAENRILLEFLQTILVSSRIAAFWIDAACGAIILVALVFS